jgi:hypothetical protein
MNLNLDDSDIHNFHSLGNSGTLGNSNPALKLTFMDTDHSVLSINTGANNLTHEEHEDRERLIQQAREDVKSNRKS